MLQLDNHSNHIDSTEELIANKLNKELSMLSLILMKDIVLDTFALVPQTFFFSLIVSRCSFRRYHMFCHDAYKKKELNNMTVGMGSIAYII